MRKKRTAGFCGPAWPRLSEAGRRMIPVLLTMLLLVGISVLPAFAAGETGDVAGAVEQTWLAAREQVKGVVNRVVFPVIDLVLAVLFFVKVATAYLDFRKHGQFEWTGPAILLATLLFSLTAPLYLWKII